jgi:hypothetical protein
VQRYGQGGEHQGTEEATGHEPRIDDRLVDRLERTDKGPVIGAAKAGHDRVGVESEGTRCEAHRHRGRDQHRDSQRIQRTPPTFVATP